jgi:mRNA interferase RelE/StbE
MPATTARLIQAKIEQLATDPFAQNNNVKRLEGRSGYRLRVGNWRVIHEIQEMRIVIYVPAIAPRGGIYLPTIPDISPVFTLAWLPPILGLGALQRRQAHVDDLAILDPLLCCNRNKPRLQRVFTGNFLRRSRTRTDSGIWLKHPPRATRP